MSETSSPGTKKVLLEEFINPAIAQVVVTPSGAAEFDLSSIPPVEPLLLGKPVEVIPNLVKRLCGICPIPHHLAGVSALEQLMGLQPSSAAVMVRDILCDSSIITTLSPRLLPFAPEQVRVVLAFGRAAAKAVGCPGHFPDVAIPGGVRAEQVSVPALEQLVSLAATLPDLQAYIDVPALTPEQQQLLACPEGIERTGCYVGIGEGAVPAAAGAHPVLAQAHAIVAACQRIAQAAEALTALAAEQDFAAVLEEGCGDDGASTSISAGTATGRSFGPRGVLEHTYVCDDAGVLVDCTITTPTQVNQAWLSAMLSTAVAVDSDPSTLELCIRAADPCVPATSAPWGAMELHVVPTAS